MDSIQHLSLPFNMLRNLIYLDLCWNSLQLVGRNILSLIADRNIRAPLLYLYLRCTRIGGTIPENFGNNMSALRELGLD
ncbi:unnamed protein product [Cuscuta epithymum]|uniref:Uncharacterized protein n=1 Tax=Cuscuta epithymum TaxID=186058 RepID=A0AAV0F333_9ASTE|nr:unnamed protein product [Cuscuta epithymum]